MSTVGRLHHQAMEHADLALLAKRAGDGAAVLVHTCQAFVLEREAALAVANRRRAEPTRSVLLRSAATLALDCQEVVEALRLVAFALIGDPPPEIEAELLEVLDALRARGERSNA